MTKFEDGILHLRDGRDLAWRMWGEQGPVVLRIQGTPGSRVFHHPDGAIQERLGVRYLAADRPGYGGSTRKPGRGIADVTDDYVELLDHHGLDRVPITGTSGGGPHALAFASRHPERVSAISVIVGAAPLTAEEAARLVGVNARGYEAAQRGWQALHDFLAPVRERLLAEGMARVLDDLPEVDRAIVSDPKWQQMNREDVGEALRQGPEGWTDESMAMHGEWDFDPGAVEASVVWWHGDDDLNAPLSAARRAGAPIRDLAWRVWRGEGHFASLTHAEEIARELLSRAAP